MAAFDPSGWLVWWLCWPCSLLHVALVASRSATAAWSDVVDSGLEQMCRPQISARLVVARLAVPAPTSLCNARPTSEPMKLTGTAQRSFLRLGPSAMVSATTYKTRCSARRSRDSRRVVHLGALRRRRKPDCLRDHCRIGRRLRPEPRRPLPGHRAWTACATTRDLRQQPELRRPKRAWTALLDSEVIADQNFDVEGQHTWVPLKANPAPAEHVLTATSSTGIEFSALTEARRRSLRSTRDKQRRLSDFCRCCVTIRNEGAASRPLHQHESTGVLRHAGIGLDCRGRWPRR